MTEIWVVEAKGLFDDSSKLYKALSLASQRLITKKPVGHEPEGQRHFEERRVYTREKTDEGEKKPLSIVLIRFKADRETRYQAFVSSQLNVRPGFMFMSVPPSGCHRLSTRVASTATNRIFLFRPRTKIKFAWLPQTIDKGQESQSSLIMDCVRPTMMRLVSYLPRRR